MEAPVGEKDGQAGSTDHDGRTAWSTRRHSRSRQQPWQGRPKVDERLWSYV